MSSAELHIEQQWRGILGAAGLDSLDALMRSERGKCVSWHTRGQTYRIELDGGHVIFLKRDVRTLTMFKDALTDICRLARPEPPCIKEIGALGQVRELGISVPQPVAWGQRRSAGLPCQAAMVMTVLNGVSLHKIIQSDPPEADRSVAICAAARTAAKLYEAGLSWPDLAPKHFLIENGLAGVLDLARMRKTAMPLRTYMPRQVERFLARLRGWGGGEEDVRTFLDAMGYEKMLCPPGPPA